MSVLRFTTLFLILVANLRVHGDDGLQKVTSRHAIELPPLIEVKLNDGRVLSGHVGPETTASQLSLVLFTRRAYVRVNVTFSDVHEVRISEATHEPDQFLKKLDLYRLENLPVLDQPETLQHPQVLSVKRPKAILIHSELANWDADSEPDGLLLYLQIVDGNGQLLIEPGHLDAQLIALRPYHWRDADYPDQGPGVSALKSWGVKIRSTDFRDGVAIAKLPFLELSPEEMTAFVPWAIISARYHIAGAGVFEASASDVLIRRTGWARDDLQQITGHRKLDDDE